MADFCFSHFDVRKKLNKIRSNNKGTNLVSLTSKKIVLLTILLSSQHGLQRLRRKMVCCQSSSQKYQDFVKAVKKYGNSL